MRRITAAAAFLAVMAISLPAVAQSGHFIESGRNAPSCVQSSPTQVTCTGKVAGLGGATFEITVEAEGIASVVCINPGGNRAPGQDTSVTVPGTTGPLATPRNGQFVFSITTDDPGPLPSVPTCPNPQWTAEIVSVEFTTATLSLFEDDVLSDQVTVPVL